MIRCMHFFFISRHLSLGREFDTVPFFNMYILFLSCFISVITPAGPSALLAASPSGTLYSRMLFFF